MQTIGERLKYLIESQGYNNSSFGEKFGIDNKSLSELTRDKRNLGGVLLKRILENLPELNLNWLIQGSGPMFFGKNEEMANLPFVKEPDGIYAKNDPGEEMFLQYLDKPRVQDKIKKIINQ